TYSATMKLLGEFEDDLHIHVHLENNILYPAALKMAEGIFEK
ncbi:MAG: iron-sulfur cluster repair di-iron protein, partial [Bacteroidales bacterium]|nr:iron-sulfur cluster repair di-iron protein [Bacteroidales bacterium]